MGQAAEARTEEETTLRSTALSVATAE